MEHKSISIADQIFEKLENDILIGKYAKGDILTENGLSEELSVSRTPVREAIARLAQENLVSYTSKGVSVIGITNDDIKIIYEIRFRIEGMAASLAATNATDEQIAEMKNILDLQEFYVQKNDADNIRDMDSGFHKKLYEMTSFPPLYQTLREMHKKILKYRRASIADASRAQESLKEHRAIYEAIAAHDAKKAERLTEQHIQNAKKNIVH